MKRILLLFLVLAASAPFSGQAAVRLTDRTLRVDYIFSGDASRQDIALAHLYSIEGWAGRRVNLDRPPLQGNGQIVMRALEEDGTAGEVLYCTSFSTLFQEWLATDEAKQVRKAFENVFLLPMPDGKVRIDVTLTDFHGAVSASLSHCVDPEDILIQPIGQKPAPHVWLWKGGEDPDAAPVRADRRIDVVFVPEGYAEDEMDDFLADVRTALESFRAHEPFGHLRDRFNVVVALLPSEESGVSVPREKDWKRTTALSHFDTFYSDRYLTTQHLFALHDALAGIPYEHIVILANTDTYGGGGIFNAYTLTTARHAQFKPVVVHEFGHSFAGLADEYFSDDPYDPMYFADTEPWEKNLTTQKDFASKWKDMTGRVYRVVFSDYGWEGQATTSPKATVGLFPGGGYQKEGVWRGAEDCRMKTNSYPAFCPVCQRAIDEIIRFYTEEK